MNHEIVNLDTQSLQFDPGPFAPSFTQKLERDIYEDIAITGTKTAGAVGLAVMASTLITHPAQAKDLFQDHEIVASLDITRELIIGGLLAAGGVGKEILENRKNYSWGNLPETVGNGIMGAIIGFTIADNSVVLPAVFDKNVTLNLPEGQTGRAIIESLLFVPSVIGAIHTTKKLHDIFVGGIHKNKEERQNRRMDKLNKQFRQDLPGIHKGLNNGGNRRVANDKLNGYHASTITEELDKELLHDSAYVKNRSKSSEIYVMGNTLYFVDRNGNIFNTLQMMN